MSDRRRSIPTPARGETPRVGIVVIGRNEGERLRACIQSLTAAGDHVIYVDSGSTDGSLEWAEARGLCVVRYVPGAGGFSAAAARNAGFERVRALWPDAEYVQFVDGDCEVDGGWLERAVQELDARLDVAIVCGRVREKEPERSIYKRLCDMEFRTDPGDVRACGGIFMARARAFAAVEGFDVRVVAGEEPELCFRLRKAGWTIVRLADEMVLHESSMYRFRQWWTRMTRGGFAYAFGRALHGKSAERYYVRETRSIIVWTLGVAVATGAAFAVVGPAALVVPALYLVQTARVALDRHRRGDRPSNALLYGVFCMLGKWAQLRGIGRFWSARLTGGGAGSFDYKSGDGGGRGPTTTPSEDPA